MYISTEYRVGEVVYFTDNGHSVTRAEIMEIRVTQYANSQHVSYLLAYGDDGHELQRDESRLHRSANTAFSRWDMDHPQIAAEPAEAAEA